MSDALPSSTMRPCRMMMTRSAISATTPMSWVIRMTLVPCWRCRSRSSSSTSPCTVTSSAVVGSSAISTSGSAPAPWRSSPAGACRRTVRAETALAGFRLRKCAPPSAPRWRAGAASACDRLVCASIDSVSCRPIDSTGLSEVIGSWKIMAMRSPRMRAHLGARRASAGRYRRDGWCRMICGRQAAAGVA